MIDEFPIFYNCSVKPHLIYVHIGPTIILDPNSKRGKFSFVNPSHDLCIMDVWAPEYILLS